MTEKNKVGEVRRSQIVMTYGPGSIMNLKSGNATISIMMGELATWDKENVGFNSTTKKQRFFDDRLAKSIEEKYELKVKYFRLPPVELSDKRRGFESEFNPKAHLVGNIFPKMMLCRKCYSIKDMHEWEPDDRSQRRFCPSCSIGKKYEYVLPSRFIAVCQNGHVDEFPYKAWLQIMGKNVDDECQHNDLQLKQAKGLGLGNLILSCRECDGFASMGGIFSKRGLQSIKCRGRHPWKIDEFANDGPSCNALLKAQPRISRSVWQPIPVSSIFVPPWDDKTANSIGDWWPRIIKRSNAEERYEYIKNNLIDINEETNSSYDLNELSKLVEKEVTNNNKSHYDLKVDEYHAFTKLKDSIENQHFKSIDVEVPKIINEFVTQISEVSKLREIRALVGFKRLNGRNEITGIGEDIKYESDWLPATEVYGEGFFIEFDNTKIENFIKNDKSAKKDLRKINKNLTMAEKKYIFLHSLSHLIMKGASVEAGYSLSSIRERVYSAEKQCGILVYTSASDSEGTLGGLSRLAKPQRMLKIFKYAYLNAANCSNDPLCGYGSLSESQENNGSACHSCLLIPETSCENFNSRLSRLIVEEFLYQKNVTDIS